MEEDAIIIKVISQAINFAEISDKVYYYSGIFPKWSFNHQLQKLQIIPRKGISSIISIRNSNNHFNSKLSITSATFDTLLLNRFTNKHIIVAFENYNPFYDVLSRLFLSLSLTNYHHTLQTILKGGWHRVFVL